MSEIKPPAIPASPDPFRPNRVAGWVLYAFTAPASALGYLWVVACCLLGLARFKTLRLEGAGILTTEWREWFAKGRDGKGLTHFSTTVGRAVIFQPGGRQVSGPRRAADPSTTLDEYIERHERVHVHQFEDAALAGFFAGLLTMIFMTARFEMRFDESLAVFFVLWCASPLSLVVGFITALLRYGHIPAPAGRSRFRHLLSIAYRDSEHERSAYAQTESLQGDVSSWWTQRDRDRRNE